ncbi:LacI family transcriptional regulator [Leucobacter luti]|uniref:LacI family transcriptional regulator n=2 Tax=Leucobacter luti TaxID=340320 RepID=A0A4Q7U887_9MICO|nr:LacI family DNA-binding transcriptional regulator [Leucobacter luti]RZT68698.1 LacI family transcriptional regulator [Leucobacter luti]
MKDVAAHAGVSAATVSRALSGGRAMNPEVQRRVQESARELGYQVNLLGRALRQQRLNIVGLMVPDLENPFFAALAEQLARTLRGNGFELLVSSAAGSVEIEAHGVQSFLGQQIHALVIIPCDELASADTLRLARERVPVVQYDRRVAAVDVPFVGCDNRAGMELLANHVRTADPAGDQVVFVGADATSSSGRERLEGFRREFPNAPALAGSFDVEWGYRAVGEIVAMGIESGTIVAAADVIALGVLTGLIGAGFRVPQDFRVVGFDGIGISQFVMPTLTTIRQPVERMSDAILELIREGVGGSESAAITLQPEFVSGASSPS